MKIERYDMIVIGAGPAGLSAAIEAAKKGLKPIVFDENAKPVGQLFKQIHKFFGSKELHRLYNVLLCLRLLRLLPSLDINQLQ